MERRVGPYTPILATLGFVLSPDRRSVLLVYRDARPEDPAFGKYNGLGGKLEPGEDVASGMRREIQEEAGLEAQELVLRGTLSWPGFGKGGEDWFGFIFLVPRWQGQPRPASPEGKLVWVPTELLLRQELPMWPGDHHFLPLVFDDDPRPFHGVMPYKDGRVVFWSYSR
ncbi:MAG: 8-oxo-dGTP diphosphatase [Meiothermus sp.]|uniref:NUDIX hydrolase n=1 Tax=Meiothermus sp. TaxID=1955249 RepID=UPI0025FC96E6|nr:8-oxo-dGTP diphosphatase [Meiothermus sp.]MCS7058468.1 8-oxo-dGTP diphosphatase [Meiothermus sp.]MCS7193398.1 8-oxo-dGTP diphosphatase [Meiothermus sp.]MCX7739793.1 8-oxo-dGTP diphosphatase [Meiothermus sp.]MDW8090911.1 8-oxo-dGTP diphosphatase [Meiothermus sp.]